MRCAWSGGFLVGLHEIGLLPNTIVTRSGNAGSAVYLATNQSDSIKNIWTKHLPGTRFIRWWRFSKVIDIDYLVDDVFVKKEPMDLHTLKTSPIKVFIACYNLTKQRIDYFDNQTITLEVLRATKALPIVYGKQVSIGNSVYADHVFPLQNLINDQVRNLVGKTIVVDVRQRHGLLPFLYHTLTGKQRALEELSSYSLLIKPETINAHLLSNSKKVLQKTFNQGYNYALTHRDELHSYTNS